MCRQGKRQLLRRVQCSIGIAVGIRVCSESWSIIIKKHTT